MKKFSKWILSTLCAVFAFAGVATLQNTEEVTTASASVATEYEVVDTTVMARLEEVYSPNGNFSLYFLIPELDTGNKNASLSFTGVELSGVFEQLGVFDNVKIGNKTLRELGCTGFWQNSIGINAVEKGAFPYNHLQLYCHADPDTLMAAINAGEVSIANSPVTVAEGTLLPGYAYLNGDSDAKLYRASCEYETVNYSPSERNYGKESRGKTDVDEMRYVQPYQDGYGYLGISFEGDDYLGDGTQVEANQNYKSHYTPFTANILINGESDKALYYGLFNLGEKGKGYYSFAVSVPEEEIESITIPAGSYFPTRAMNKLFSINNTYPVIVYVTQTTQTFYKAADGSFVSLEMYDDKMLAILEESANAKLNDCFAEDTAILTEALASGRNGITAATTIEGIDEAYLTAKAVVDGVQTKSEVVASATAELDGYKAEEGYFRTAEKTQRDEMVASAKASFDTITNKQVLIDLVATTKASIDGLKTAAQYADEELAEVKATARAEIEGYLSNVAYLDEQASEKATAVANGLTAVASAKNETEIAEAVATAKTTIDGLITKAAAVDTAKAELNAYKATEGLYREAEATARAGIITDAEAVINTTTSYAVILATVEEAKASIDTLKTDEELTAEEKAAADSVLAGEKENALAQINEIKASVIFTKYSTENQMKVNELYKTAKDTVANALTKEALDEAVAVFKVAIEGLPQDAGTVTDTNDSTSDSQATNMMGCGSFVGVSAVTGVSLALGVVALTLKKRKED